MLLNECIDHCLDATYPFFNDDAAVTEVLAFLQERGLGSVPVLHEGKAAAIVTIPDLQPSAQPKTGDGLRLADLQLENTGSVRRHEHLFDIFSRIHTFPHSIIPVSEENGLYAGIIQKVTLLEKIAGVFHLGEEGLTLELEVPYAGLKLSGVIELLEKNDATVLSFGSYFPLPEVESMVATFRVQTHDLFRLVKNMEKYGYSIRYASAFVKEGDDELREKALEFIRYMDM